MAAKYWNAITDAELDIMKVLWKTGPVESSVIFATMETKRSKHIGTNKTLLTRLVRKGAIERKALNSRRYLYTPVISKEEFINESRQWIIQRIFDGDAMEMLTNLIREEKITIESIEMAR